MNVIFLDKGIEELYTERRTTDRRYKNFNRDLDFLNHLAKVIDLLFEAPSTDRLKCVSFLHYEKLKHTDKSSVRIKNGRVERLLFKENDGGIEISLIEINMNHYGKKK